MKIKQILLVSFISIIIFSCKKDENTNQITTPVEDTVWLKAACTIRDFKADLSRVTVDTVFSQIGKLTSITSYDAGNYKMVITFQGRDTGTYILGSTSKLNYVSFYSPSNELWRSTTNGGILRITKYDVLNHKISGTFSSEIKKTTASFDYQYIDNGEFVDLTITGF